MNSNFSDTSDPTIFAGGGNSREWDTAKPGRAGPGGSHLARPVVYSNHGTKPDPACVMLISPTVGHARSARDRLPGPACDILRSFFSLVFELWLLLFLLEVWRPQRARYSPRRAVSLGSRLLFTSDVRNRVCHAPLPAFGYRWCVWVAWCLD